MKKIYTLVAICFFVSTINAQVKEELPTDHLTCKTNYKYYEECRKKGISPDATPEAIADEEYTKAFAENFTSYKNNRGGSVYIVPIVFHVLHLGGAENISDAQIIDAVAILNRDYRKLNADTSATIAAFKPIAADVEFEFRLAQRDALGNCVNGITRHYSNTTDVGDESCADAVNKDLNGTTSTAANYYPRDKYLNIWVVRYAQGAAGYTQTPGAASFTPKYDGIWILHGYVGSIGTSMPLHSRALTHEVGHWFNLKHCWGGSNTPGCDGTIMTAPCSGDDNCTIDDNVTDTPNTIGWQTCNVAGSTCTAGLDNVQNYMEYSYCTNMFTEGQKTRMHAAITSSTASRNNLWKPANLALTGVDGSANLCLADFTSDAKLICAGDSITFTDISYNGVTGWNYVFGGGTPVTSLLQNPTITYNVPGTYDVGLIANDGTSSVNVVKNGYISVLDPVGDSIPFFEGFETVSTIPNADWFISNTDAQEKWQVASGVGATGAKCIKLDNFSFNNEGGKDAVLSKTYDLSSATSAYIYFKYAYRQKLSTNNEKLRLMVSYNCGTSWSTKLQLQGSTLSGGQVLSTAYTPSSGDWMTFAPTGLSSSFFTQGFMFKIEFESDFGNNIYIDDINLDVVSGVNELDPLGINFGVYPNPITNSSTINYELKSAKNISISITDVLGKQLGVIESGIKTAGKHSLPLNANLFSSKGIYFVSILCDGQSQTQKVIVD